MRPDQSLYRDFPRELKAAYSAAIQAQSWGDRHSGLLDFAETALGYVASLCLSDYRTRSPQPVQKVEVLLERSRNQPLTFGRLLNLFRTSVEAMPDPLVPGPDAFPPSRLESTQRLQAAVTAIETAVEGLSQAAAPAAIDVRVTVGRALSAWQAGGTASWWKGWQRLVEYRNRVVHPGRARWPVHGEGYWETMTPLLHDCLVELLTMDTVVQAVLDHPVAAITLLSEGKEGRFVHRVSGETRGLWFEQDVVAETSVIERWADEHWKATMASSYVLDPDDGGWRFRSLFWDLRNGLPPAMDMRLGDGDAEAVDRSSGGRERRPKAREGRGVAPGTCGEFVQGQLPDGTHFHITCPINKSASVIAQLRPAQDLTVLGLSAHQRKLGLAIEYAVAELDLGATEVTIRHWSDLDIAKGMGSSTADVLSGLRAVADAAGERFDAEIEGRLAARVESSDGSMYPGIAAVNHKTCEIVRAWDWYPEFVIVMLVPRDSVDTQSISFDGQEELADEYQRLLEEMNGAVEERSISRFAVQSTQSAILNERFLLNPYSRRLSGRLEDLGALGLNVGHTGTVCGLLFPNTDSGRTRASEVCFEMRQEFRELKDVKVVTTPRCPTRHL
jgi:L-threonine kinase